MKSKWTIVTNSRGREYARCCGLVFPCYKKTVQKTDDMIWIKEIKRYIVNKSFG